MQYDVRKYTIIHKTITFSTGNNNNNNTIVCKRFWCFKVFFFLINVSVRVSLWVPQLISWALKLMTM